MRLPEAVKRPGRFSLLLSRTGDEASSVLYLPNARLRPEGKPMGALDADGVQFFALPEGGARVTLLTGELKKKKDLYAFAHRAFALGRLNLLESAFTAVVILNDVYEDEGEERNFMAVRYEGCALTPLGNGRWELRLRAPGTLGTVAGENYIDLDECFAEGWPYGA